MASLSLRLVLPPVLLCGCLSFDLPPMEMAPPAPNPQPAPLLGWGLRSFPRPERYTPPGPAMTPTLLSQTGLYGAIAQKTLAPGVVPFQPNYQLWSDGADKSRFVLLPAGHKINTENMDRWRFPVGAKFWKEFKKDGKRLETRLIWKRVEPSFEDAGWVMQTYLWNDEETEAVLEEAGKMGVRGTDHEVPRQIDCIRCHRVEFEAPVGFSALQLGGAGTGLRLRDLVMQDLLSNPPPSPDGYTVPGGAAAPVLGYLHANCGGCHAPDSAVFQDINMSLRLEVGKLASVALTPTYLTTVNQMTTSIKAGARGRIRVKPGLPMESEIYQRMGIRMVGPESLMMPSVGSAQVDVAARAQVAAWISGLP